MSLWKIYFWVVVGFLVLNIYFFASLDIGFSKLIQLIFTFLVVLGLYSYVFKKHLLPNSVWKYLLYLYLTIISIRLLYSVLPLDTLLPLPKQTESNLPQFHANYWIANLMGELFTLFVTLPIPFALYRLADEKASKVSKRKKQKPKS